MAKDLSILRYLELPDQGPFRQQRVSLTWGKRTKSVDGVLRLVQLVVKTLLTSIGSDSFSPFSGTIIPGLLKKGVTRSSAQQIKTDIMISIQDAERQIIDNQASQSIQDSERLRELEIRRVEFLDVTGEWIIELSVLSHAGEEVAFDISQFLRGQ